MLAELLNEGRFFRYNPAFPAVFSMWGIELVQPKDAKVGDQMMALPLITGLHWGLAVHVRRDSNRKRELVLLAEGSVGWKPAWTTEHVSFEAFAKALRAKSVNGRIRIKAKPLIWRGAGSREEFHEARWSLPESVREPLLVWLDMVMSDPSIVE